MKAKIVKYDARLKPARVTLELSEAPKIMKMGTEFEVTKEIGIE